MSERGGGGEAVWWAALGRVPGVGAATMLRLARLFGSPREALLAAQAELIARGELTAEQAEEAARLAASIDSVRSDLDAYARQGIGTLAMEDPGYPPGLLDLRSPPPLLYVSGSIAPGDARAVAIVGTRDPDAAGSRLAGSLARELAGRGFTIVSGLARGIDTAGHRGALAVPSGRTLAALGCGLQRIYPPENRVLARRIAERGALLSEVPPETEVDRRLLLARDRLQAGLCRAMIVVQAHRECGSIVAARHAAQCRRLLLGVPWRKAPFSDGWSRLEEMGAQPVSEAADLDALAAQIETWRPEPEQGALC